MGFASPATAAAAAAFISVARCAAMLPTASAGCRHRAPVEVGRPSPPPTPPYQPASAPLVMGASATAGIASTQNPTAEPPNQRDPYYRAPPSRPCRVLGGPEQDRLISTVASSVRSAATTEVFLGGFSFNPNGIWPVPARSVPVQTAHTAMLSNVTLIVSGTHPKAHGARYGQELNSTVPWPSQGTWKVVGMVCGFE